MLLTKKQLEIMEIGGHLLVTGGPGSGKTTISILKAAHIAERELRPGQKILFLSFARATVSRVMEAIEYEQRIPREQKKRIDVETYHSFFWRMLKAHGYLVGLPRKLNILSPPNEAIALSTIRSGYPPESKLSDIEKTEKQSKEEIERINLACDEGQICFDLFARYTGKILHGSKRIRKLVATMYPVIILDEFQDTNTDQWRVVLSLGSHCILTALADPEQRIYDWIGADPERLNHFREAFDPTEVDLSTDNHRSGDTDIVAFGNDILKGKFNKATYTGVSVLLYEPNSNQAKTQLVTTTYEARRRLIDGGCQDWVLAILVPTKRMTRIVSDTFQSPPAGMKEIPHTAIIEMEAAILGAEIIAFLMQPDIEDNHFGNFIDLLCNYFLGKGGDAPTKGDLQEAESIRDAYNDLLTRYAVGKEIRKNCILVPILDVYGKTRAQALIGEPDKDWLTIRRILEDGTCSRLKEIAEEVRNVRLLQRGTQLRQALSQDWRDNNSYNNALAITKHAFLQYHFATNTKPETGVVVMNMHKAKGKQFDEVIIFEGWPNIVKRKIVANHDRVVRSNSRNNDTDDARYNFRVSVTRGKLRTTILTPKSDPCIYLRYSPYISSRP